MTPKYDFLAIDSGRGVELPRHRIYAVAYEPAWQGLRQELSWTEVEDVRKALAVLNVYIKKPVDPVTEVFRVWRVRNLLAALPIGQVGRFYSYMIPPPTEKAIIKMRKEMNEILNGAWLKLVWDWNYSRSRTRRLYVEDPGAFGNMVYDIKVRLSRRAKKTELHYYMTIISEVIDGKYT